MNTRVIIGEEDLGGRNSFAESQRQKRFKDCVHTDFWKVSVCERGEGIVTWRERQSKSQVCVSEKGRTLFLRLQHEERRRVRSSFLPESGLLLSMYFVHVSAEVTYTHSHSA